MTDGDQRKQRSGGGRRRAEPVQRPVNPYLVLAGLIAGFLGGAAAWYGLVKAAIYFGHEGRVGSGAAWLLLGLATVGAIACLALVLALGSRLWQLLGLRRRHGKH
ncbi:MAG: hypothetical protein HZY75_08770 [Nocardioidaceae bacterium]|nr:MAG: hypothetical protein HZY75_08770 [Nocardioidaceae bacterium]